MGGIGMTGKGAVRELAIVILSFNVKELLLKCLGSIYKGEPEAEIWQIVVVDNASSDGSSEAVRKRYPGVKVISSPKNVGFAAGNNLALAKVLTPFVLFLNPDTVVDPGAISKSLDFLNSHPEAGAVTCRVELPDGRLDYSCHRGFPTPWNSFCYFTGLARLWPKSRLFAGYTATYQDLNTVHEMDCGSGTFFLVRTEAGVAVAKAKATKGWWDEDYFWNGEDIEFCWRLRKLGWKIYFYPKARIIHYKSSSSGLWSTAGIQVPLETRLAATKSATQAMRIFYRKHYLDKSPKIVAAAVEMGINWLERRRLRAISRGGRYES